MDDRQQPWYRELKIQAARAVLKVGSTTLCRSFCRFGVPHAYRAAVWEAALGLGPPGRGGAEDAEAVLATLCAEVQVKGASTGARRCLGFTVSVLYFWCTSGIHHVCIRKRYLPSSMLVACPNLSS